MTKEEVKEIKDKIAEYKQKILKEKKAIKHSINMIELYNQYIAKSESQINLFGGEK